MDDYSIVRDDYYYIKEKAFKHLSRVMLTDMINTIKEDKGRSKQNAEDVIREEEDLGLKHKQNVPPLDQHSRHIRCPVHPVVMKTINLETIYIDYCPECYGIWLDFGELESLLVKKITKTHFFQDKLTEPVNKEENSSIIKKCPLCKEKLFQKKHFQSNLYIDVCRICLGIWLDSGEFAALYLENRKNNSIETILAGVVGNYIDITA